MRTHELEIGSAWILTALPTLTLAWIVALGPLALAVAAAPSTLMRAAAVTAALAVVGLFAIEAPGAVALAFTLPYFVVTVIAGASGVARLLARPRPAARAAVALGLVFLPAGATWLCAARAGYDLLGYAPFWVHLTAAHFFVAGAYTAIIAGRAAHGCGPWRGALAASLPAAVALTAAGIWGPAWLEAASAWLLALLALALGALLALSPRRAARPPLARLAGLALGVSMPLAAWFAARGAAPPLRLWGFDELSSMLISHGAINAVVFATAGLLAFGPAPAELRAQLAAAPPMSKLWGVGAIGAAFLTRRKLVREVALPPRGLVDRLEDLAHGELDASAVAPEIRAFYERTADHEMIFEPRWRPGFRAGSRLWAAIARRLGQLQLPPHGAPEGEALRSQLVAVDERADGRRAPRGWVRTYPDGRALYVAVYATHRRAGHAYMNIAFPLPGSNLTSILRMAPLANGVSVSTRAGGDCGIWLAVRWPGGALPIRLPMDETIHVWTADDEAAPAELRRWAKGYALVAQHRLWLFGVLFLTLRYAMRPRDAATAARQSQE